MLKIFIFLAAFLFTPKIYAKPILTSNSFESIGLSDQSFYFEDKNSTHTVTDILKLVEAGKLSPPENGKTSFGFSASSWWMASALVNETSENIKAVVIQRYALVDTIEFWLLDTQGNILSLQRFRPAYFFTLAWFTLIFANILRMAATSGSIERSPLTEWGVVFGSVIEAALISLALADKVRLTEKHTFDRISSLNKNLRQESAKVQNLNENLEQLVEEKTREIQSIMTNISLGILVIRGDDLLVSETFSKASLAIFKTSTIGTMPAIDLMFRDAQISNEAKEQVKSVLESAIGEDEVNFESNSHLLPREITFQFKSDERHYQFDWKAIVDANDKTEKVLVVVKDVTDLRKLEASAREKSLELEYIGEILDVTSQKFSAFISSSTKSLVNHKGNVRSELLHLDSLPTLPDTPTSVRASPTPLPWSQYVTSAG
jgi:hypothetical protein